ncbi:hypothetical protein ThvES_00008490 [Thiovulum sp. ES]|nr:hypothetical protein ThvES_00008490 [Thiovulum sp. ES]
MDFIIKDPKFKKEFFETGKKGNEISEKKRIEEEKAEKERIKIEKHQEIIEENLPEINLTEKDFLDKVPKITEVKNTSIKIDYKEPMKFIEEEKKIQHNDENIEYFTTEASGDLEDTVFDIKDSVIDLETNVFDIKDEVLKISEEQKNIKDKIENSEIKNEIYNLDLTVSEIKNSVLKIAKRQEFVLDILSRVEKLERGFESKFVKPKNQVNINSTETNILRKNIEIFNSKLLIIDSNSSNIEVQNFLKILEKISEGINTNYFYIFSTTSSPIQDALNYIKRFENRVNCKSDFHELQYILQTIENISLDQFEFKRYFKYADFVFERKIILNSVILLNESITKYILDSIKAFSREVGEKIDEAEKKDKEHKISMGFKNFFIREFPESEEDKKYDKNLIEVFGKDFLNSISIKLQKIHTTAKYRGDGEFFKKLSHIAKKIRHLRNNMSHGNMQQSLSHILKDYSNSLKEYEFICLQKDILQIKKNSKKSNP